MKKLALLILAFCSLFSCKKAIEDIQGNIILDAMTNGQWIVYEFTSAGENLTSEFDPYSFQFYRDGSVSALTSSSDTKGTWAGNTTNRTITAEFPGASDPLGNLNAVWRMTDSSWDFVKAETTLNNIRKTVWLRKK